MENCTTSGCTVWCACRSSSLFLTPMRCPTIPQVTLRRSVSRSRGSTSPPQVGWACASSCCSAVASSVKSCCIAGTTCAGRMRSKRGKTDDCSRGLVSAVVCVVLTVCPLLYLDNVTLNEWSAGPSLVVLLYVPVGVSPILNYGGEEWHGATLRVAFEKNPNSQRLFGGCSHGTLP